MTRKAILLSASPSSAPIPGVHTDIASWQLFLSSNPGGAWSRQEIVHLNNCDREAALAAVRSAKDVDYSLIVFAGNGEILKGDLPWPEAQVLLSNGDSLPERELNPRTPRCTIIFDCCRRTSDYDESAALTKDAAPLPAEQDTVKLRALFDQSLTTAESGLVKIYAIEAATAAAHEPSFSRQLLYQANAWAKQHHGALSLQQGVSLAAEATRKTNPLQKPEYQGGRRLHHFPLAVSL
jgi:hypothetical protein